MSKLIILFLCVGAFTLLPSVILNGAKQSEESQDKIIDDSTRKVIRRFSSFIERKSGTQRKSKGKVTSRSHLSPIQVERPQIDSFVDRDKDGINDLLNKRTEESLFGFLNKIAEDYLGATTSSKEAQLGGAKEGKSESQISKSLTETEPIKKKLYMKPTKKKK